MFKCVNCFPHPPITTPYCEHGTRYDSGFLYRLTTAQIYLAACVTILGPLTTLENIVWIPALLEHYDPDMDPGHQRRVEERSQTDPLEWQLMELENLSVAMMYLSAEEFLECTAELTALCNLKVELLELELKG